MLNFLSGGSLDAFISEFIRLKLGRPDDRRTEHLDGSFAFRCFLEGAGPQACRRMTLQIWR